MSIDSSTPMRHIAATLALSAILSVGLTASAQTKAAIDFSSSPDAVNAMASTNNSLPATDSSSSAGMSAESSDAAPAAPSPIGGQRDASYGYNYDHHHFYNHLAFEAGGGANAPIGNDQPFITWGGNFTVGAGLRIQKHVSLLAEYQFIDDKLPGGLIADAGAQGGHAHIWSLTLDPVVDLFPNRKNDVYFTGGGGFYRKVTSFTDPEEVEECYYFCEVGVDNVVVSHFSSNQGGANFGVGITRKLNSDSNLKVFAEARYVWINTPAIGNTDGLGTTGLIPATVGVRW